MLRKVIVVEGLPQRQQRALDRSIAVAFGAEALDLFPGRTDDRADPAEYEQQVRIPPGGGRPFAKIGAIGEGGFLVPGQAEDGVRIGRRNGPTSEEHTSELQSLMRSSYAVFCLKTKINHYTNPTHKPTIHTKLRK